MKLLDAIPKMVVVGTLVAFMGSANAGDDEPMVGDGPIKEDFSIFPTRVTGQTCVEDPDNKEIKCSTLVSKDLVTVAEIDVMFPSGSDVNSQFCAKVEDNNQPQLGLECQVVFDNDSENPLAPGGIQPNEDADEEIYWFCMSWFGTALNTNMTVDVQCRLKNEPTDDTQVVNINSYSFGVTSSN